ncbi:MAG: hypothetical protein WD081_09080 [Gammaproteobacteria bacterium]
MWRYLIAWFGLMVIAIGNGFIREFFIETRYSTGVAYQLSTVLLLVLFTAYFWWLFKRWPLKSTGQAWALGTVWLLLTVGFEFGIGLLGGLSWQEMLQQYNVAAGDLWIAVPIYVFIAPRLFAR